MKSIIKRAFRLSILIVLVFIVSCSPKEENDLKVILKKIDKAHTQIINVYNNQNISWEVKEQQISSLIFKVGEYIEMFPSAYQEAILVVPPEKLENYQSKYNEAVSRLSDLIKSITNK